MSKVWILGSINADLVALSERFPAKGETILGKTFSQNPGGKGANQAVACARLGADVFMIGATGLDASGIALRKFLENERINVDNIYQHPTLSTGVALITVAENDNIIVVVPGANMAIPPAFGDMLDITEGDVCVAQMEVPVDAIMTFFQKAKEAKAVSILNPSPASTLASDPIRKADVIILNETELGFYVSKETGKFISLSQVSEYVSDLHLSSDQLLVVTLGERGAVCFRGNKFLHEVPALEVKVTDTTGAGDCFCGAFAYFMSKGLKVEEALRAANFAASMSVQKSGAASSMPTISEFSLSYKG